MVSRFHPDRQRTPVWAILALWIAPSSAFVEEPRVPEAWEDMVAVVPPTPALSEAIQVELARAPLGRGHLDLSADPDVDEVRVHAMLGAAVQIPRWQLCRDLRISIDGVPVSARLRPALVPMPGGVYDAVTADLTILDVRAMASARNVRLDLCGETLLLPSEAAPRLARFVERFYRLGEEELPVQPAPLPLVIPLEDDLPEPPMKPTSA